MGTALHHDGGLYERIGMHAARMAATPQRRRCGDRKNLRDCVQIGRGLPEGKKLPHDRSWTPEQHGLPLLEIDFPLTSQPCCYLRSDASGGGVIRGFAFAAMNLIRKS